MTREWAFGQDTDLTIGECEWGIPYTYNSSDSYDAIALEAANAIERLTRERDEAHQRYVDANEARIDAERKVEMLREALEKICTLDFTLVPGGIDYDAAFEPGQCCLIARAALKETSDE